MEKEEMHHKQPLTQEDMESLEKTVMNNMEKAKKYLRLPITQEDMDLIEKLKDNDIETRISKTHLEILFAKHARTATITIPYQVLAEVGLKKVLQDLKPYATEYQQKLKEIKAGKYDMYSLIIYCFSQQMKQAQQGDPAAISKFDDDKKEIVEKSLALKKVYAKELKTIRKQEATQHYNQGLKEIYELINSYHRNRPDFNMINELSPKEKAATTQLKFKLAANQRYSLELKKTIYEVLF